MQVFDAVRDEQSGAWVAVGALLVHGPAQHDHLGEGERRGVGETGGVARPFKLCGERWYAGRRVLPGVCQAVEMPQCQPVLASAREKNTWAACRATIISVSSFSTKATAFSYNSEVVKFTLVSCVIPDMAYTQEVVRQRLICTNSMAIRCHQVHIVCGSTRQQDQPMCTP